MAKEKLQKSTVRHFKFSIDEHVSSLFDYSITKFYPFSIIKAQWNSSRDDVSYKIIYGLVDSPRS